MNIFNSVGDTIKKYGSSVTIRQDGSAIETKAFVQPLRYKNRVYVGGEYHVLGYQRREKYLYIGNPSYRLTENSSVIETQGDKYIVKRRETYFVKDYPVYEWAILLPFGEKLEDDYESDRISG